MVYVLKIKDEVIGIFDKVNELALAIWQHRDEIKLPEWCYSVDDIIDYMEYSPIDFNGAMKGAMIADYELNIDYITYRTPSLTAKYEQELEKENRAWEKEHL